MLSLPVWITVLIQIHKGKNQEAHYRSSYSKMILNQLKEERLIEINDGLIRLNEEAIKIVEGVSYGFFEEL